MLIDEVDALGEVVGVRSPGHLRRRSTPGFWLLLQSTPPDMVTRELVEKPVNSLLGCPRAWLEDWCKAFAST